MSNQEFWKDHVGLCVHFQIKFLKCSLISPHSGCGQKISGHENLNVLPSSFYFLYVKIAWKVQISAWKNIDRTSELEVYKERKKDRNTSKTTVNSLATVLFKFLFLMCFKSMCLYLVSLFKSGMLEYKFCFVCSLVFVLKNFF
jgi:hypothetical protein